MAIRIRSTTLAALGVAAVLVAACDRRDNTVVRSDSAGGTVVKTDTLNRSFTDNDWTEESILAYLRAQDMDEIKVNELAAKKATTPAVKQFAAKMISDHRAGLKEVESMMKKTGTKADSLANPIHAAVTVHERAHDVLNKTRDEVKDLTDKAAGADWDKDYIDMQIDEHKDVLDKLHDAAKNTMNKDLQAMLVKVSGTVQEHLTKAEAIKATFK